MYLQNENTINSANFQLGVKFEAVGKITTKFHFFSNFIYSGTHFRYKNGQEIKPSPKITMKEISPKKFELAITKALLNDTASYKVPWNL